MLETKRLKIVPLTHEQLLLYKYNPEQLALELNIRYTQRQNDPLVDGDLQEATEFWIKKTAIHPTEFQWYTTWEIILKDENVAVGGIGFSGAPGDHCTSMIGYGLDIRYHRKGIASEALEAMIKWGFLNGLETIVADTPINHYASQSVLIKSGFVESGRDETVIHWRLDK
ncbi:MAG TPA: GNAT family N-acetyltransferase [Chryseosolibacter sp.]|nr:GNAT family N-acetyltransferase [Chryseosolibacter sp.]